MKKSKIILLIVLILATVIGIGVFLFAKTDLLKSNGEVFFEYLSQSVEETEGILNPKIAETYTSIKNKEKYEIKTTLDIEYSEGGEMSNPFNDVSVITLTQKDTNYDYSDFKLLFGDQNVIELEGIQDNAIVGIRFSNLLSRFVSIDMDKELQIAEGDNNEEKVSDLEESITETKKVIIDLMSNDSKEYLKNKYLNIIVNTLKMANFSKQSGSTITLDSEQKNVDMYVAEISSNDMQNFMLEILKEIKSEEKFSNIYSKYPALEKHLENLIRKIEVSEIPVTKVMVYKKGSQAVGIGIDYGSKQIISYINNKENSIQMQYNALNSEVQKTIVIKTAQKAEASQKNYTTAIKYINGEDVAECNISANTNENNMNYNIEYKKGIKKLVINLTNNIFDEISEKVKLDSENNLVLNDLDTTSLSSTIGVLVTQVPSLLKTRFDWLLNKVNSTEGFSNIISNINKFLKDTGNDEEDANSTTNNEKEQLEINQFNAKFEFYNGTGKTYDDIKQLLESVKDNLIDVEFTMVNTETSGNKQKQSIKLNIQKDTENNELADSIMTKIEERKNYEITINYNSESGLIDSITILEE